MLLLCGLGAWEVLAIARGWERKVMGDERE